MKYKSELIKEIVESRGHEKSSLHYESECVETWIKEAKGGYPKLCDYQSEWLSYINKLEGGGTEQPPIGEFPYIVLSDVTEANIDNVVPYVYKSAILKGNTKYRDIDTGDILDTFDETKNLELVSVKVPVLTTTGKNLFDGYLEKGWSRTDGSLIDMDRTRTNLIFVEKNETYTVSRNKKTTLKIDEFDGNSNFIKTTTYQTANVTLTTSAQTKYIRVLIAEPLDKVANHGMQLEKGTQATSYEPYKSNILTVNEDVTLRSNGDVYDELNLLTGRLTQRIDENNEVLAQAVVKTVDLTVVNQDGENVSLKPIEGTMHLSTSSETINPLFSGEIPVEAITQNLASFIGE